MSTTAIAQDLGRGETTVRAWFRKGWGFLLPMETDKPKCGDDCKLVEMLASKTSKEQAMENAIAAVKTGKISQRAAARVHGVAESTLRDNLKGTGTVRGSAHDATPAKPTPGNEKAISAEEREQWWADHQAGLSARKMVESDWPCDRSRSCCHPC